MKMPEYKLDKEEQEILDAFESGEMQPIPNAAQEIERHKKYAAATFKKDKRINIRLTSQDLNRIRKLAMSEGIPYQTFIASILHKFADGRYLEKQFHQEKN
jgi:predicted DNA binding CopG/RHH family protein